MVELKNLTDLVMVFGSWYVSFSNGGSLNNKSGTYVVRPAVAI